MEKKKKREREKIDEKVERIKKKRINNEMKEDTKKDEWKESNKRVRSLY